MKYVKIQSNKTIRVTAGLQFIDNTNVNANTNDKLKVSAEWPKLSILITKGEPQWYPEYITKWNTVQALVKRGVMTISNEVRDDSEVKEEIKEVANKVENNMKEYNKKVGKVKKEVSLEKLGE